MTFGKQLFLIFAAATVVPLMILWFSLADIMYQKEVADVSAKHLLIARHLSSALQRYHSDIKSGFEIVSQNLVAGTKIENVTNFIENLNFRHFCVADSVTGRVISQAAPTKVPCSKTISANHLAVFNALATTTEPVFSPVMAGPQNQSLIFVVQKFGTKLVVGAVRTDYFVEIGKSVSFGKKGHAAIVDQNGTVLAHPKSNWISARKNISKISIVKRMLAGERGVATFYSPALKADMIAGFTGIKDTGWGVMIPQPISELRQAAKTAQNTVFPIITICVLLAGLVASVVARMVMKPLNSMIEVAKAVEDGKHDIAIDVDESWHVPHEFKDMQNRFNAMAQSVAKYQAAQKQERQAAEEDSKNKTEYFANLAHELKTPLNSILGFSGVLRKAPPGSLKPHEEFEFLGHIEKSAGHLLSFVNDLLDLNRLDMGVHQTNEQKFRLIDPIRFCETTLRKQIENKEIDLVVECEDKDLKIFADERSLNQILINLVGNAVRYSLDKGQVKISTWLTTTGDLQVEVHDNGIGIPEQDLELILLPFKRANDPNLTEIHGTGLGLSIVSKLARLHDITFTIESEHGFNTTAKLTIPRKRIVSDDNVNRVA